MVETVLVTTVLVAMALGILQLALVGHVRSVLAAVSAEGAREGGRAGSSPAAGAAYAERAAHDALGAGVTCSGRTLTAPDTTLQTVVVTCVTDLSTRVLPVGRVHLVTRGRALRETP